MSNLTVEKRRGGYKSQLVEYSSDQGEKDSFLPPVQYSRLQTKFKTPSSNQYDSKLRTAQQKCSQLERQLKKITILCQEQEESLRRKYKVETQLKEIIEADEAKLQFLETQLTAAKKRNRELIRQNKAQIKEQQVLKRERGQLAPTESVLSFSQQGVTRRQITEGSSLYTARNSNNENIRPAKMVADFVEKLKGHRLHPGVQVIIQDFCLQLLHSQSRFTDTHVSGIKSTESALSKTIMEDVNCSPNYQLLSKSIEHICRSQATVTPNRSMAERALEELIPNIPISEPQKSQKSKLNFSESSTVLREERQNYLQRGLREERREQDVTVRQTEDVSRSKSRRKKIFS